MVANVLRKFVIKAVVVVVNGGDAAFAIEVAESGVEHLDDKNDPRIVAGDDADAVATRLLPRDTKKRNDIVELGKGKRTPRRERSARLDKQGS